MNDNVKPARNRDYKYVVMRVSKAEPLDIDSAAVKLILNKQGIDQDKMSCLIYCFATEEDRNEFEAYNG